MYKLLPIEEYLETPKIKELPQEIQEDIRRVRTEYEPMSFEQFTMLHTELRIVKRTVKLKKPRSLWVCPEGKIWFFCHYHQVFKYAGYFHTEEFLQERAEKEAEERRLIEERRAAKKALKQRERERNQVKKVPEHLNKQPLTKEECFPVKPKRKRIKR